ncbi:long-chain fatty acid--CoA ligase [Amycolatopsis sp.]|uniref:long-chain fatty acid--CoA ligase n=1 Tax=Amycolatopsis sp. TaxID=37632 RepID=UPI002B7D7050|nr:long-chain fatty acid--CoA ligase [Amycolatopsis sp.]HVV10469.1 long-chain fatty acid--CoA ligase [Amycolatopsis sp.]
MTSTMQDDFPLTVSAILEHGSRVFGESECVTWQGGGAEHVTYAEIGADARRLARALANLGIARGDRVGTFSWNTRAHLEAYYAVPGMGAVLHTLNIRLTPRQLADIVNHAEDRLIIVDGTLLPQIVAAQDEFATVEAFIVVGDAPIEDLNKPAYRYSDLLAAEEPVFDWPELDERSPATMCYTSGTTGDPKGVVYSHRSMFLHALGTLSTQATGPRESDRWLALVPMFHVNAWGIPYTAFLSGSSVLLPGRFMSPADIAGFIAAERATVAAAVPTIWSGLHQHARTHEVDLSSVRLGTSGGAAIPRSLVEAFETGHGLRIIQGWGMTETSPLGGMAHPPAGVEPGSPEEIDWRMMSGRVLAGVQMRTVGTNGAVLPWDGRSAGEIEVRGPWITGSYHRTEAPEKFHGGWLRTGDIGTIDPRGFFRITDRAKDVIKSGGEWISSVELETLLMGSPHVLEAAVIGIPDEKWTERPLALVVARETVAPSELAEFLAGKVAGWQVPENWAFVDAIPKTTVGKFDKKALRSRYGAGQFDIIRTKP